MKLGVSVLAVVVGVASAFTAQQKPAFARSALFASVETDAPSMNRARTKVPVFDEVCETTGVTLTRFMNEGTFY